MYVMAMWLMRLVAVAPCQCFTAGGIQTTSPGLISRRSPCHSCTQPTPEVTISVWPAGWVCQAVRAQGSNVTRPPVAWVCSVASKRGSITTEPVKLGVAPLAEGRELFGVTSMADPLLMGTPVCWVWASATRLAVADAAAALAPGSPPGGRLAKTSFTTGTAEKTWGQPA